MHSPTQSYPLTNAHTQTQLTVHIHSKTAQNTCTSSCIHSSRIPVPTELASYVLMCKHTHASPHTLTCAKPYSPYSHMRMCKQAHRHRPIIQLFVNTNARSCTYSQPTPTHQQPCTHLLTLMHGVFIPAPTPEIPLRHSHPQTHTLGF